MATNLWITLERSGRTLALLPPLLLVIVTSRLPTAMWTQLKRAEQAPRKIVEMVTAYRRRRKKYCRYFTKESILLVHVQKLNNSRNILVIKVCHKNLSLFRFFASRRVALSLVISRFFAKPLTFRFSPSPLLLVASWTHHQRDNSLSPSEVLILEMSVTLKHSLIIIRIFISSSSRITTPHLWILTIFEMRKTHFSVSIRRKSVEPLVTWNTTSPRGRCALHRFLLISLTNKRLLFQHQYFQNLERPRWRFWSKPREDVHC